MFAKIAMLGVVLWGLFTFGVPAKAANADYMFILGARGNPYWEAMAKGIQETAKDKNVTVAIHRLSTETAAEEELNLCQSLSAQKPKMLIIEAVNASVSQQCLKIAHHQGVPFADVDTLPSPQEVKAAEAPRVFSVGSDNLKIGREAAKYAASILRKGDKIAILEGAPGHVNAMKRLKGFQDEIVKLSPHSPIVASVSAQWDRLKANSITTDLLTRTPDLKLIYAANDMMGLGAAEAVRAAGKEKQVSIVAVDGTKDARQAIMAGRMQATVAQLPYLMGKRAVELAVEAEKTGAAGVIEVIPTPVLTKTVIQKNKNPLLRYVH